METVQIVGTNISDGYYCEMKTGKALQKYISKRTDAIDAFLGKTKQEFTSENFHKLRVEIKKLDAFFKLLNFCSKGFKRKRTFKPFEKIFEQAGKVRELYLEEATLKKYAPTDSLKEYLHLLKMRKLKERNFFFSLINEKLISELEKKYDTIVPFLARTDKKCVPLYLDKKRKKIESLFKKNIIETKDAHELRKRLKEFYYVRKCVHMKGQKSLLKKMDAFQELIGQWHDCRVVDRHLIKVIDEGEMHPQEVRHLEKVKARLFSKAEVLFNKINFARQKLSVS